MTLFAPSGEDWRDTLRQLRRPRLHEAFLAAGLDDEEIEHLEEVLERCGYVVCPLEPVEEMWRAAGTVPVSDQPKRSKKRPIGELAAAQAWTLMARLMLVRPGRRAFDESLAAAGERRQQQQWQQGEPGTSEPAAVPRFGQFA